MQKFHANIKNYKITGAMDDVLLTGIFFLIPGSVFYFKQPLYKKKTGLTLK